MMVLRELTPDLDDSDVVIMSLRVLNQEFAGAHGQHIDNPAYGIRLMGICLDGTYKLVFRDDQDNIVTTLSMSKGHFYTLNERACDSYTHQVISKPGPRKVLIVGFGIRGDRPIGFDALKKRWPNDLHWDTATTPTTTTTSTSSSRRRSSKTQSSSRSSK
jgi:hypothetical protein